MKVYVGETGLDKTWQADFPKEVDCPYCKEGKARIGFVAIEGEDDDKEEYMCELHDNDYENDNGWLHDVCAVGFYVCGKCFEGVTLWNQA